MMPTRRILAVTILAIMGVLQLWDSHVFTAGADVITVAVIALMLPWARCCSASGWRFARRAWSPARSCC
jgi:hypothetical protein